MIKEENTLMGENPYREDTQHDELGSDHELELKTETGETFAKIKITEDEFNKLEKGWDGLTRGQKDELLVQFSDRIKRQL
jgi:hypothetical protein